MAIPIGFITAYAGLVADIPERWALCDGANGTQDLRDKFIYATAVEAEIGDVGGSADAVIVAHEHSATFAGANLTGHSHIGWVIYSAPAEGGGGDASQAMAGEGGSQAVSSGTPSGTVAIVASGEASTGANNPPFLKLLYIQKVA